MKDDQRLIFPTINFLLSSHDLCNRSKEKVFEEIENILRETFPEIDKKIDEIISPENLTIPIHFSSAAEKTFKRKIDSYKRAFDEEIKKDKAEESMSEELFSRVRSTTYRYIEEVKKEIQFLALLFSDKNNKKNQVINKDCFVRAIKLFEKLNSMATTEIRKATA